MAAEVSGLASATLAQWINIALVVVTIAAIIVGPLAAVWLARKMDAERETRDRKLSIFRALMSTRGMRMANEHVMALNLLMVEFHNDTAVVDRYKKYVMHLYLSHPKVEDQEPFFEEREDLFTDLLKEMATVLGYIFDGRELGRLSYAPRGWMQDDHRQRRIQFLLMDLLDGKRALPIAAAPVNAEHNPFPPPPDEDGKQNPTSAD